MRPLSSCFCIAVPSPSDSERGLGVGAGTITIVTLVLAFFIAFLANQSKIVDKLHPVTDFLRECVATRGCPCPPTRRLS